MKRHLPALVAIGLVGYLLLVPFGYQLEANADTERDLFRTWGLLHGDWPDKTPRIDHSPLGLGPAWYVFAAGPLALADGDTRAVHVAHVCVLMLGFAAIYLALQRAIGPPAATILILLFGTSNFLSQVMVRVWHPALFPASTLLWFGAIVACVQSHSAARRSWWLAIAWLLFFWLTQLHLVAAPFGVATLALSFATFRRDRLSGGPLPALVCVAVPVALSIVWAIDLANFGLAQATALSDQRLTRDGASVAALIELPQFFASAWATPPIRLSGLAVLGLAGYGALRGIRSSTHHPAARWVLLEIAIGIPVVLYLARLAPQARYFSGIVPGVYLLAAFGLGALFAHLSQRAQWSIVAATALCVIWGGWGRWPVGEGQPIQSAGALTLHEQDVFAAWAHARGVDSSTLAVRSHGAVYGGLTAIRWVAFAQEQGPPLDVTASLQGDLFVAPEGFPEPEVITTRHVEGSTETRPLVIAEAPRRLSDTHVRVGDTACPITLPYRWGPLTSGEYSAFDVRQGLDLEHCRTDRTALLTITTRAPNPAPLHLMLEWYDVAARHQAEATVRIYTQDGQPVEATRLHSELLRDRAMYRFAPPAGRFTIEAGPLDSLAVVDIY